MNFAKSVKKIRDLDVQGAENTALFAVKVLTGLVLGERTRPAGLLKKIVKAADELSKARPTEPCMQNALNFMIWSLPSDASLIQRELKSLRSAVLAHFASSSKLISCFSAEKISSGMTVFTHCHSSTVMEVLKLARKQGKKFNVHVTETRPFLQGRTTATELASLGVPVTLFADSAGRLALKKADIMLIGSDAITAEGKVINKIGSELLALAANKLDVPVYVCTDSWKFDPRSVFGFERELEERSQKELWDKPPRGVAISNIVFEKVDPRLITAIISELGICRPEVFGDKVRRAYPWMFR